MRAKAMWLNRSVIMLIAGGFYIHLINLSNYIWKGKNALDTIMLPLLDGVLALFMYWSAIAMVFCSKQFFARFGITSLWRKIGYWVITAYILISLPGHTNFMIKAFMGQYDIEYFAQFPWWLSAVLPFWYGSVLTYMFTLKEVPEQAA